MSTARSDSSMSPLEKDTIAPVERRRTQEEQNNVDDEKRKGALRELVASWMERLQLISLITTFFASVEATLINITTGDPAHQSGIQQAANATLLSALVMHSSAVEAIVSFLAGFFLINYRVNEARREEVEAEGGKVYESAPNTFGPAVDPVIHHPTAFKTKFKPVRGSTVWSVNPHLVQVGPFHGQPPTNVLGRCHSLSVLLATIGFVLCMLGTLCFAWSKHALSASIFTTIWIGICLLLGMAILVVPDVEIVKPGGMAGILRLAHVS
ncbi:hypothetical protein APHAL10511_004769 [Amanita phalloides]|nr:hypothetical protein APHAL10511_004769 [Amanita phalloides]